ncbi:MAG: hypothetical protein DMF21_07720 [Verrucomicrobia bacterium]|nr:MAG: hypothetical protein DMF21_07720 [Verrucomicrobiota bacterium]
MLSDLFIFICEHIGDQQGALFRVRRIFRYLLRGCLYSLHRDRTKALTAWDMAIRMAVTVGYASFIYD